MSTTRHPERKFRRADENDFTQILQLQRENLLSHLDEEAREEGFLSVEFTASQLAEISRTSGIFAAFENGRMLGYLMAETIEFGRRSPIIAVMVNRLDRLLFLGTSLKDASVFIYGPVCIDRCCRGQRVLEGLYNLMRESLKGQFDVGVAFVSKSNPRSYYAHVKKLGMSVIDEFHYQGNSFWTLAFSLR